MTCNTLQRSKTLVLTILTLLLPSNSFGSDSTQISSWQQLPKVQVAFGYNRAVFNRSDITLLNIPGYKLTLMKARATDVQIRGLQDLKPFSYGPYSLRVGLRYTGRSVVSVAFDHMRYKVVEDQTVDAVGSISAESYPQYGNLLSDGQIELTPEVFRFEHTDGLNYVSVEHDYLITRIDSASRLHFWTGLALGAYIPRTESYVLDDGGNHKYHLSGWGTSVHTQVQWRVAGSLFIEGRIKAGYIDLNDILLGSRSSDARASQRLGFVLFTCSGLYLF